MQSLSRPEWDALTLPSLFAFLIQSWMIGAAMKFLGHATKYCRQLRSSAIPFRCSLAAGESSVRRLPLNEADFDEIEQALRETRSL